jgi:hypothetical protein
MATKLGWLALPLGLCACGGEVLQPASTTTTTSHGGTGGAPAACTPQPDGAGGTLTQPTCADLGGLTVSDPKLADDSGNGKLAYQESAIVSVKLNEVAGKGFNFYPGVHFSSDTVSVASDGTDQFYAILPCQSVDASAKLTLLTQVTPGTTVHVTARVSMLGSDCPEAYGIDIPIEIE